MSLSGPVYQQERQHGSFQIEVSLIFRHLFSQVLGPSIFFRLILLVRQSGDEICRSDHKIPPLLIIITIIMVENTTKCRFCHLQKNNFGEKGGDISDLVEWLLDGPVRLMHESLICRDQTCYQKKRRKTVRQRVTVSSLWSQEEQNWWASESPSQAWKSLFRVASVEQVCLPACLPAWFSAWHALTSEMWCLKVKSSGKRTPLAVGSRQSRPDNRVDCRLPALRNILHQRASK